MRLLTPLGIRTATVALIALCAVALALADCGFTDPTDDPNTPGFGWKFEYDDDDRLTKTTDPTGRDTRW